MLVCLRVLEWGVRVWGSSYKDQHFPGTPYPAAMISDHSSSSKIFLKPLTFHWAADITVSHYLIILWCSVLAMQCLCCKWKSCQSLLEMKVLHLSTHLLSVRSQSSFHGAVANEGAIRLSPRRHYRVFIWNCLMFQPLVIWTLFHVHHQKDIKQDAAFKIRSQSLGQMWCACVCVQWLPIYCILCEYLERRYFFFS